jgi:hypothetical protein
MWTELWTEPGSRSFRVGDTLTNRGDYEREFQIIYTATSVLRCCRKARCSRQRSSR